MTKNTIALATAFLILCSKPSVFSQNLAGVVNLYASATAFDTCSGRLTVAASLGFQIGQAVLIYQSQGATIATSNNSSFGNVSALGSAGLFEVNEITDVGPNFLLLKYRLENAYDWATGKVQAVASPKIAAATVADTVFSKKWDGLRGGVIFLKGRKIQIEKPIDASGAGFRGGVSNSPSGNNCSWLVAQSDFSYDSNNWRGSLKGEGIASFSASKEAGKGAQANGGGGGNDHNSGGGGGANLKKGGDGGKNAEPETFNCNGNHPGVGGKSIVFSGKPRLFMGGGGGSGHGNNALGGDGGAGGGLVVIVADTITGAAAAIFSNGQNGETAQGDGAGGGGAGGSIYLFVQKNSAILTAKANGGNGGNSKNSGEARCFGPGGGGAAGRAICNLALSPTLSGGTAGIVEASTDGCNGSSNGGQSGDSGAFELLPALSAVPGSLRQAGPVRLMAQPKSLQICLGEPIVFSTSAMGGDLVFEWELKEQAGWTAILAGNTNFSGQKSPVLTVAPAAFPIGGPYELRCRVRANNGCGHPIEFTQVAELEVFAKPTVDFSATAQAGLTLFFQNLAQNTTGQMWSFGDAATSSQPNPTHQYSTAGQFTVTLTAWNACDTLSITKIVSTDAPPSAFFEVADSVFGCGNSVQVDFENGSSGAASAFAWKFPGGQPAASALQNPTISYASPGIYAASLIATNGAGKDTFSRTFKVFFQAAPVALFQISNVSGYKVTLQNLSLSGDSYQWDFGDGTTFSGFSPPNPHIFPAGGPRIITLVVQNACGAAIYQLFVDLAYTATEGVLAEKWGLALAPNPTDGLVRIEFKKAASEPFLIQVFDATGRLFFEKNEAEKAVELNLGDRAAGLYFLKIQSSEGQILRRIIKN